MDHLWLVFMSLSVVLKSTATALPHAAGPLGAAGDAALSLAFLFANPQAALASLRGMVVPAPKPVLPAEIKA